MDVPLLMPHIHGAQQLPTMIRMATLEYAWVSKLVIYTLYVFEMMMIHLSK